MTHTISLFILVDDAATALRLAAKNGDLDTVVLLLGKDTNNTDLINQADENGWQALHETVRGGYLEVFLFQCTLNLKLL